MDDHVLGGLLAVVLALVVAALLLVLLLGEFFFERLYLSLEVLVEIAQIFDRGLDFGFP